MNGASALFAGVNGEEHRVLRLFYKDGFDRGEGDPHPGRRELANDKIEAGSERVEYCFRNMCFYICRYR